MPAEILKVFRGHRSINTTLNHYVFYAEESRRRGEFVHKACNYYDEVDLDPATVSPALLGYLSAWVAFKLDSRVELTAIEKPVYSALHLFAGTPDRLAKLNGYNAIIDIKSGAAPPWVGLQLAGYSLCLPDPGAWKRYSLQLTEDAKYKLKEFRDRNDLAVFLSALSIHNWRINNGG